MAARAIPREDQVSWLDGPVNIAARPAVSTGADDTTVEKVLDRGDHLHQLRRVRVLRAQRVLDEDDAPGATRGRAPKRKGDVSLRAYRVEITSSMGVQQRRAPRRCVRGRNDVQNRRRHVDGITAGRFLRQRHGDGSVGEPASVTVGFDGLASELRPGQGKELARVEGPPQGLEVGDGELLAPVQGRRARDAARRKVGEPVTYCKVGASVSISPCIAICARVSWFKILPNTGTSHESDNLSRRVIRPGKVGGDAEDMVTRARPQQCVA